MKPSKGVLSDNHWFMEGYRQRMSAEEWKQILLNGDDKIIARGSLRTLKAKRLGYGVVEVYKEKEVQL